MNIRNYGGADTSLDGFKAVLGHYLNMIPDKSRDIKGVWYPKSSGYQRSFLQLNSIWEAMAAMVKSLL